MAKIDNLAKMIMKKGRGRRPFDGGITIRQLRAGVFWFCFLVGIWVLPFIAVWIFGSTLELSFILMLWQQSLFSLTGFFHAQPGVFKQQKIGVFRQGFVYGVTLFLINAGLSVLTFQVLAFLLGPRAAQAMLLKDRANVTCFFQSGKPSLVLGVAFLVVFGAPLGEELFFRAFLLERLHPKIGAKKSILFTALVFASLHFSLFQFPAVLAAGIFLGAIFLKTGDIMIPIIAHGVANGLVLLIMLATL